MSRSPSEARPDGWALRSSPPRCRAIRRCRALAVFPLPLSAIVHQIVVTLIGNGLGDLDFAALLELEARGANFRLVPDRRQVADGLEAAHPGGPDGKA